METLTHNDTIVILWVTSRPDYWHWLLTDRYGRDVVELLRWNGRKSFLLKIRRSQTSSAQNAKRRPFCPQFSALFVNNKSSVSSSPPLSSHIPCLIRHSSHILSSGSRQLRLNERRVLVLTSQYVTACKFVFEVMMSHGPAGKLERPVYRND